MCVLLADTETYGFSLELVFLGFIALLSWCVEVILWAKFGREPTCKCKLFTCDQRLNANTSGRLI